MRRWILLVAVMAGTAHGQVIGLNPTPQAQYYWNTSTNSFAPCTNTSTAQPFFSTPQAVVLEGYNSALHQWTPATSCPANGSVAPVAASSLSVIGTDVNATLPQGGIFSSGALQVLQYGSGTWAGLGSPNLVGQADSYMVWGTAQTNSGTSPEAEYRSAIFHTQLLQDFTASLTQTNAIVAVKNGTNDFAPVLYAYWAANCGVQSSSDEGCEPEVVQGGQQRYGSSLIGTVTTLTNNQQQVITVNTTVCQSGWGLPFDNCIPSQGSRIWKDAGISGRITGVSANASGLTGCSSYSGIIKQFPTTMSLPVASAWGCATGLTINPHTTPNFPVTETVTLTGGHNLLAVGEAVNIGSERPENILITGVAGSAGAQTVTFLTSYPTTSVFFIQGTHVGGGLGFVGTKSVTGLYDNYWYVGSVDGSTALYTVEGYSETGFGNYSLPVNQPEIAVANPTFTPSAAYTTSPQQYVFDGTNVQKVITAGTAGSTVTWATSCAGNLTSGVGCTTTTGGVVFVNLGPVTTVELYDAARVTNTNVVDNCPTTQTCNPRWTPVSWQIEANQMSLATGNSIIEPNFDAQRLVSLTHAIQCLTPGNNNGNQCAAAIFNTSGPGNGQFDNGVVEIDNNNPGSLYLNYDGVSVYTPTGIPQTNQIVGVGYFAALNQEYYAPSGGLYNFVVGLQPNQTSVGLLGFGGGYHGSYTPGTDTWGFNNINVSGTITGAIAPLTTKYVSNFSGADPGAKVTAAAAAVIAAGGGTVVMDIPGSYTVTPFDYGTSAASTAGIQLHYILPIYGTWSYTMNNEAACGSTVYSGVTIDGLVQGLTPAWTYQPLAGATLYANICTAHTVNGGGGGTWYGRINGIFSSNPNAVTFASGANILLRDTADNSVFTNNAILETGGADNVCLKAQNNGTSLYMANNNNFCSPYNLSYATGGAAWVIGDCSSYPSSCSSDITLQSHDIYAVNNTFNAPAQSNHAIWVKNGQDITIDNAHVEGNGAIGTFTITSCAAPSGGSQVCTGTITGGGSSAFAGAVAYIAGFTSTATVNNGWYPITASTATTITVTNSSGISATQAATANIAYSDFLVDANSNDVMIRGGSINSATCVSGTTNLCPAKLAVQSMTPGYVDVSGLTTFENGGDFYAKTIYLATLKGTFGYASGSLQFVIPTYNVGALAATSVTTQGLTVSVPSGNAQATIQTLGAGSAQMNFQNASTTMQFGNQLGGFGGLNGGDSVNGIHFSFQTNGNACTGGNITSTGCAGGLFYVGPATAPSGACTTNGQWEFTQDGHATYCASGTWVSKI